MIKTWWNAAAPRERLLIGIAGGLTVLVILVFGLLQPLLTAKAEARIGLERAQQDQMLVERAVRTVQAAAVGAGPARDSDAFRADATRAAQSKGLAISRLQSGDDGSVQFVFSDAAAPEIFAWLQEVSQLPGGKPIGASLSKREDKVQAVIRLQGTMP